MKFDIAMLVPGLPIHAKVLESGSLGGSESAGIYLAQALARIGHRPRVFGTINEIQRDDFGVEYYPNSFWTTYSRNTPHDVTIVQRIPSAFSQRCTSKLNVLWQHDLMHGRDAKDLRGVMWNVNKIAVVSKYMRDQYREVCPLEESSYFVTRNGLDLDLFPTVIGGEPDRKRLIYSARPERGLDVLLRDIMPRLIAADPEFRLHIYGYHNPVSHFEPLYEACRRASEALGEGVVTWHKPLSKRDLYMEYVKHRGIYVYPTPSEAMKQFAEVSCITAMEMQASGIPIVTSERGALTETIAPGAGTLIPGDPWSESYVQRFVDAVLTYSRDENAYRMAAERGKVRAESLSWDGVAADWDHMIREHLDVAVNDKWRLARHFFKQSDIVALRELQFRGGIEPDLNTKINHMLEPFEELFHGPERFAAHYANAFDQSPALFENARNEVRYGLLKDWLMNNPEIKTVLDYGCGVGGGAAWLSQETGKKFFGVDVDRRSIEDIARPKRAEHNIPISDVTYAIGTHDNIGWIGADLIGNPAAETMPPEAEGKVLFDAAVLQEVLEHVPQPWKVLEAVEARVKPGGMVYVEVPFGPWEYGSYHDFAGRCHIWHFDSHDIRDMMGSKEDLAISTFYAGDNDQLGDSQGWWLVSYKADHKPIRAPDMNRKLRLQAPRHTVSACLIVGGEAASETLKWTLKSLTHVADEILVADCGMDDAAKRIVEEFPYAKNTQRCLKTARIVPGINPLEHGFEEARNLAMKEAVGDFVLWIDCDERFINPRELGKYLRDNQFHAYGIRQHHFAVDTSFAPDMPARLFRRRPDPQGRVMRFWGALHEHPELELNKGPGPVVVLSDVHIAHVGYLVETGRQQRFMRNYPLLKLDQQRYPERLLQKHFIMRDTMVLVREALKANGNNVDKNIRAKCWEVVELYRKYFLGKPTYSTANSTQYYSDALAVLGEGFDTALALGVSKAGEAGVGPVNKYRYANKEDLLADITASINEAVGDQESAWW